MNARIAITWQESLFWVVVSTITILGTALVLIVGGVQVLRGGMTIGDLTVVIAYLGAVYGPLSTIAHTAGTLQGAVAGAKRVRSMLAMAPETIDAPDAIDAAGHPGRGHVRPGRRSPIRTARRSCDDISFTARPGEMIALVGLTGAGKTTLVSLIPRFYDPTVGRVLIDGLDVRRYRLRSLRERIAIVLQDPVLFAGTIADNLRYGRLDATDAEVEEAARAAHAHEFVSHLPKRYDTPIAEAGGGLSGGERQRLSVARAILKNAPILILDEPTSSLDAISEEIVFAALRRLRAGRTTIVIAHRLSTVRDADRILVLDGGRIAAQGRHEELLQTSLPLSPHVRAPLGRPVARRAGERRRADPGGGNDEPSAFDVRWLSSFAAVRRTPNVERRRMKILFAGIIARYPFGGVTWCSLMYLLGLRALGHEVFYIEDTGECVYDPVQNTRSTDPSYGTSLHPPGARTLRPGRSMVVRQLRRHLSRPAGGGRPALLRRCRPVPEPVGRIMVLARRIRANPAGRLHRLRPRVHPARHRQGRTLVCRVLRAVRRISSRSAPISARRRRPCRSVRSRGTRRGSR